MENASKALLIAGAILIVIVLISVGLLVIRSTGSIQDRVKIDSETIAIRTFNSQFIYYEKEENSASQIKSLLNTAQSSNGVNSNHIVDVIWENNSGERRQVKGSEITADKTYSVALEYGTDGYIKLAKLSAKLSCKPDPTPEEPEPPTLTDRTAPIITVSSNSEYKKSQTGEITIEDYDTGLKTGTYTIKYTWTQNVAEPNWNNVTTTTTIKATDGTSPATTSVTKNDGTGTYYLHAKAIKLEDKAGNTAEPTAKGTFLIDNTPPRITSVTYNSSTDTLTITAQDEHSGIGGYKLNGDSSWSNEEQTSYNFGLKPNTLSYSASVKDKLGNSTTRPINLCEGLLKKDCPSCHGAGTITQTVSGHPCGSPAINITSSESSYPTSTCSICHKAYRKITYSWSYSCGHPGCSQVYITPNCSCSGQNMVNVTPGPCRLFYWWRSSECQL